MFTVIGVLWFFGYMLLNISIRNYCALNNRSKIRVKVAAVKWYLK